MNGMDRKLQQIINPDILDSLQAKLGLEDAIYLQLDKLLALCAVQSVMDSSENPPALTTRSHYSMIMEEHAQELRRLIDQLFN